MCTEYERYRLSKDNLAFSFKVLGENISLLARMRFMQTYVICYNNIRHFKTAL